MASKQAARKPYLLEPLTTILFVSAKDTTEIPPETITQEQVGEKAFGLSCLPKPWTLPFIVVSGELMSLYKSCHKAKRDRLLKRWAKKIIAAALVVGIKDQEPIIVRSSGCSEGLEERGKFYSSDGTLNNTLQPLQECLQKLVSDKDLEKERIPLVIQEYALPISAKGHLSNERRCYKEKRDWLGEFEQQESGMANPTFNINLRNWRKKIIVGKRTGESLTCNLTARVSEVLKIPAAWGYERRLRLHFEWVWDGKAIYLVQVDREHDSIGVDPTIAHKSLRSVTSDFAPKCLNVITKKHARYNKISNVFTYLKLGLPITKLYVLDNQKVINGLASGHVPSELKEDLSELVKGSLVIRMDIATDDINRRQLLPRTHEVREIRSALEWLKKTSAKIKAKRIRDDLVFIFHNFVPAVSSAFAYAKPGERKVQIEALWGLPEGIYYNSHDKYIVDTRSPQVKMLRPDNMGRFEVREKLNFKQFFVAPNQDGLWTTKILKQPYDWGGSIRQQEWVKEIALESRRIAEEEGKPLSIMWFVDVPREACSRTIFPWYHEYYDSGIVSRSPTHRTKTPFDKSLVIKTNEDIEVLRREAKKNRSSVRRVRIQPQEEALIRDKDTLRVIGELTQKIGAIILLEGGMLSHAYYQLMKTKAIVEVVHPFADFEDKREFNKLVRDKVPSNIKSGGEVVFETRITGEFLLRALREKLVEEAFEVMDAVDQDSIIGELADVAEVVDGILSQLNVNRASLQKRQSQKRKKKGGFQDGLVLLDTKNPLPTKVGVDMFGNLEKQDASDSLHIDDRKVIELGHKVDKWSDRREHQAAKEIILRLVVPMVRDSWTASTLEMVVESDSGNVFRAKAKITGKRSGAKLKVSLSIFTPQTQLELF